MAMEKIDADACDENHSAPGKSYKFKKGSRCHRCSGEGLFLVLAFAGIVVGFVVGIGLREADPSPEAIVWIGMIGELYMRLLKVLVLPLVICSVIDGTASIDPKSSGKMGLVSFTYILITNVLGTALGVVAFLVVRPGWHDDSRESKSLDTRNLKTMDIFADFVRNLVPNNIVGATLRQTQTRYTEELIVQQMNVSGELVNLTSTQFRKSLANVDGTNITGLVVCCTALGIAASKSDKLGRPFVKLIQSIFAIFMRVFSWVKWTTPIGVASLIARALVGTENLDSAFLSMGMFLVTHCGMNILYGLIILPLIYFAITRCNPLSFLRSIIKACIIGFAPPSSMAALPEMTRVSTEVYKIDPRLAKFVLSFCVTLNRDCSMTFIATTCLFIAQTGGVEMSVGLYFNIIVLGSLTSFAIPAVRSASVVSVLIILESLAVQPINVGLILAVEWISDRVRSTANVVSHMVATMVTWHLCKSSFADGEQNGDATRLQEDEKALEITLM